jgi:hypothetical protein
MMDHPEPPAEPVRYVGGMTDAPRPPAWPYVLIAGALVLLIVGGVLLWKPIRSLGQNAGETIAPYSLALSAFRWSSDQKIASVPLSFSLTVANSDQRTIHGVTMRFTRLDAPWKLLSASSANADGAISGTSIYFAGTIPPGGSASLSVGLLPTRAMDSEIDFTLTAGHGTTPARVQLGDGSVATMLAIGARVREPTQSDADARLTAFYDPQVAKDDVAVWQIHVANTGPIAINGIRLRFPDTQAAFEFRVSASQATVLSDGQTVEFPVVLPPGGQTILEVGVIPHQTGHFQLPMLVFLGEATQPMSAANGGPPLSIDLLVN